MNKIIINVGRQIGSGGHIIAEKSQEVKELLPYRPVC